MDYNLNTDDIEEEMKQKDNKWPKTAKILMILFICICLALTAALITFIILYTKKSKDKPKEEQKKSDDMPNIDVYNFFGLKYSNLTYDDNGKIENTFKKNGENYNESMGEINNGSDYEKNIEIFMTYIYLNML